MLPTIIIKALVLKILDEINVVATSSLMTIAEW